MQSIRYLPFSIVTPIKFLANPMLYDLHPGIEGVKQHCRAVWWPEKVQQPHPESGNLANGATPG